MADVASMRGGEEGLAFPADSHQATLGKCEQAVALNGINQRDRFEVNPESWTQLKGSLQFSYLGNGDSCLGDIEKIGFIPNAL